MWWTGFFVCRNRKKISCCAVKAGSEVVSYSLGKWETTKRGCKAFQSVWITVVVILSAPLSTWWGVACKESKSVLCSNKNCLSRTAPVALAKHKCQELISEYPKTTDYSEDYPIVRKRNAATCEKKLSRTYDLLCHTYDLLCHKYDLLSRTYDLLSRTYDLLSRTYDLLSRTYDLLSRTYDF